MNEARKVFSLIATINNKQLPTEKLTLAENNHGTVEEGGFLDLVHTRAQGTRTAILWFAW